MEIKFLYVYAEPPVKEGHKALTYRLTVGAQDHTFSPRRQLPFTRRSKRTFVLMHMHGIAKVPDDPLGAEAARLDFIRIASFTMQHLLVAHGHAASTHPVLAVARVNMVKIGQTGTPRDLQASAVLDTLSEYQIGCECNP